MAKLSPNDRDEYSDPPSKRRRYSVKEKLVMVNIIKKMIDDDNLSKLEACRRMNIHRKQFNQWSSQESEIKDKKKFNANAKSLNKGRTRTFDGIREDLMKYIFELREKGMTVNITLVRLTAIRLSPEFGNRSRNAQYKAIQRFVKKVGLVYRLTTHQATTHPSETRGEALDFIEYIRPVVGAKHRHQDYIYNMDQTPLPFSYNRKKTLAKKGTRSVHARSSTKDTKRATLALTITASGKRLTPLLVFKGAANGDIMRQTSEYPQEFFYQVQENAWMDERVMLFWVDNVLAPHARTAPAGIEPIIFLDSYRCHCMASVVHKIQDLGIQVEIIPGGCTYLCQPLDVGINKPFKDHMRNEWEFWMTAEGICLQNTLPPSREQVAEWALGAFHNVTTETI